MIDKVIIFLNIKVRHTGFEHRMGFESCMPIAKENAQGDIEIV